ncbi:MAG TPA: LPS assembly lipoprotein LptE [Candidatus Binataceae bacterium]
MTRGIRAWFAAMLGGSLLLAAAGCGYHFASSGSGLPQDAKTIYVARFSNVSRFTGFNDQFMRYMKDEIAEHKRLQLVEEPSQADLVLTGELLRVETAPAGFNAVSEASIYQQYMVVRAQLEDRHTGKVLWANVLSSIDQFPTVSQTTVTTSPEFLQQNLRSQNIANMPDIQVAQTQQAGSTTQMMTRMAQDIYSAMSEGF